MQGAAASVLSSNTILSNNGVGVRVSGMTGALIENNFIQSNGRTTGLSGIDFGADGAAYVHQNTIGGTTQQLGNGGYGVFATYGAYPSFGRLSGSGLGSGYNLLAGNTLGGLYASDGALIAAGSSDGHGDRNALFDNHLPSGQSLDAEARDGSAIYARSMVRAVCRRSAPGIRLGAHF